MHPTPDEIREYRNTVVDYLTKPECEYLEARLKELDEKYPMIAVLSAYGTKAI